MTQEQKPQHTPEPWVVDARRPYLIARVGRCFITIGSPPIGGGPEYSVGTMAASEANAKRIVACINASAGVSTEALEKGEMVLVPRDVLEAYMYRAHHHESCEWGSEGCTCGLDQRIAILEAALEAAQKGKK